MFDLKKKKLDIIILAGQSNAEGNGISNDDVIETRNDVLEMVDSNIYFFDLTDPNKPFLQITLPVQPKIQCLQERVGETKIASDFSFSFVDLYKNSNFYNEDRTILVIKAGVGGTGFCRNEWGVTSFLYKRMLDMVNKALSLNPENKIVALLWHQGECDAFENANLSPKEKEKFYYNSFMSQMLDFKEKYNSYNFPIIMGEFVNEWSNLEENKVSTEAIENALYACAKSLGNSAVVSSENLKSNNEEIHNGDNIHFSKPSLKELGKRYFEAFVKLR